MKKVIFMLAATVSLCCGCSCGNKEIFDTTYSYDKAICKIGEEYKEIKVKKWKDYEGEQLQIWDKEGNYYLVSSVNCTWISILKEQYRVATIEERRDIRTSLFKNIHLNEKQKEQVWEQIVS